MLPEASQLLARVNDDPALLKHRAEQRDWIVTGDRCRADIASRCLAQCGGNTNCVAACNGMNAGQFNRWAGGSEQRARAITPHKFVPPFVPQIVPQSDHGSRSNKLKC
jgi:hypothetical protein